LRRVGRYLDAGEDRHRDRVIEGRDWGLDFVEEDGCSKCLVGHAEDWRRGINKQEMYKTKALDIVGISACWEQNLYGTVVFNQFPRLCHRFGKDRIVRLCKMRAAKGNTELVEEIRNGSFVPTALSLTLKR